MEKAGGVESLVYELRGDTLRLGQAIHNEVLRGTPQISRGVKARSDLWVLRRTKMLACLVEYGFMDKLEEARLMLNKEFQEECARETLTGICKFFDIKFDDVIEDNWKTLVRAAADDGED